MVAACIRGPFPINTGSAGTAAITASLAGFAFKSGDQIVQYTNNGSVYFIHMEV